MHVRNLLMHVRNKCMYFQKHKTTKYGLQIFLVCVVWRYHVKVSWPDQIIILRTRNQWITFQYQKQPFAGVLFKQVVLKKFAIFTENLLCWSLFLVKFQPSSLQLYWNKDCSTVVFQWILQTFKKTFYRTPPDNCLSSIYTKRKCKKVNRDKLKPTRKKLWTKISGLG